jgi:hypothetical protein
MFRDEVSLTETALTDRQTVESQTQIEAVMVKTWDHFDTL